MFLDTPDRTTKPRERGLTILIDPGLPLEAFRDVVSSFGEMIDLIKLGWCTAPLTPILKDKLMLARSQGIDVFPGGTLFEAAWRQRKLDAYYTYCQRVGFTTIEISNGTVDLENRAKARCIEEVASRFRVFSEVGYKDVDRSLDLHPARWIEFIEQDLDAGAYKVITEARESGRSGICRADGQLRFGLIREIMDTDIDLDRLVFEAPTKDLQVYFVQHVGPNVNLANIAFSDVVALETLRLGLRSDTLLEVGLAPDDR